MLKLNEVKFDVMLGNVTVTRRGRFVTGGERTWDLRPADYETPERLRDLLALIYSYGVEDALNNSRIDVQDSINDEHHFQQQFTNTGTRVPEE